MAGKAVLVSRDPQTPEGLSELRGFAEVRVNEGPPYSREQFRAALKDVDALLCYRDAVDDEIMSGASKLRIIANFGVGYNNIDVEAARRRGIAVTNTPDVLTEAVADLTMGLIISVARRIAEANQILKQRIPLKWEGFYLPSTEVHHKTLGIVGFGRIGRAVARRAQGFDMKVIYYDVARRDPQEEAAFNASYRDLETLLAEADFVSLHCHLSKSTFHLIGEKELSLMKPTAFLINVARGAAVDEKALIAALKRKVIAGAGLDVFEAEPTVPDELLDAPNVVVTPHMASGTRETRLAMAERACKNIIMALSGQVPQDLVNPPWQP